MGDHHPMRRAISHGQAGRLSKGDIVGNKDQLMVGNTAKFGQTSMYGFANQAAFHPVSGVDQDAVANRPVVNVGSQFDDLTGDIQATDHRHVDFDARHTVAREDIVIIQRGCFDFHNHVAGTWYWIWKIFFIDETFGPAMFMQYDCAHLTASQIMGCR
jgi:hypothetical protein